VKQARFVAQARHEFLAEVSYYRQIQNQLSLIFVASIEEAIRRAIEFPDAGSPSAAGTRCVMPAGFPFSIYYRPHANGIVIFAVAHQSRQPGYWTNRVKS
jgi:plasmid stabilization system protein ParE